MKIFVVFVLLATSYLVVADNLDSFKNCPVTTSFWGSVRNRNISPVDEKEIVPCDGDSCVLKRGNTYKIKLSFIPKRKFKSLKVKLHGKVLGLWLPLILKDNNACRNKGLECNNDGLEMNKKHTFELSLPIESIYPTGEIPVQITLEDETGDNFVCIDFDIMIVA